MKENVLYLRSLHLSKKQKNRVLDEGCLDLKVNFVQELMVMKIKNILFLKFCV